MLGDIEMEDTPAIVTDDEKATERAEGDRRNSEEVHRGNRVSVTADKGKPAPGRLRIVFRMGLLTSAWTTPRTWAADCLKVFSRQWA
jgi:hypothetical protein